MLGDLLRRARGVVGDERQPHPGLAGRGQVLGRARARRRRRRRRHRRGRAWPGRSSGTAALGRAEHGTSSGSGRARTLRCSDGRRRRGHPALVARPLRLVPFRALMLAPSRIGDPASARAFARPYRDVAGRLRDAGSAAARSTTTRSRRSTCTSTPPTASPSAASSARSTSPGGDDARDRGRRLPARGDPPRPGRRARRPDGRDGDEPGPDPARAPRHPPRCAICCGTVRDRPADHQFTDRGEQHHRIWAIRDPTDLDRLDAALRRRPGADRGRPPPVRRLPAAAAASIPAARATLGLAMLVDQDDTPALPRRDPPGPRTG